MTHLIPQDSERPKPTKAIVCAISASDSSAHAGHQCDLRVIQDLGTHGVSVVSGLTTQNSYQVSHIEITSPTSFKAQMVALREDVKLQAIKTGLLLSAAQIQHVVIFTEHMDCPLIVDPVLSATSGTDFSSAEILDAYPQLIAAADLLTPNIPEAETLLQRTLQRDEDIIAAASALREMGCKAVLIKGGHRTSKNESHFIYDYYDDGEHSFWLRQPRLRSNNSRGTGCALASAIASFVAQGKELRDAVVLANAYVHQSLLAGFAVGRGKGLLEQCGWPQDFAHYPALAPSMPQFNLPSFASCDTLQLGLYPIVESLDSLQRLLQLGVNTVQLRLKDSEAEVLAQQVSQAVSLGKRFHGRVFINDHWQLAIQYGAYGVHLGQEDLAQADLSAIQQSGLRLGVSSHSEYEWLRAASCKPSYIAMGSVFPTQTKRVHTIGLDNLWAWSRVLAPHFPLVAIGGITLDNLTEVLHCGVGSAAVVSALRSDQPLESVVRQWQQGFEAHAKATC